LFQLAVAGLLACLGYGAALAGAFDPRHDLLGRRAIEHGEQTPAL